MATRRRFLDYGLEGRRLRILLDAPLWERLEGGASRGGTSSGGAIEIILRDRFVGGWDGVRGSPRVHYDAQGGEHEQADVHEGPKR